MQSYPGSLKTNTSTQPNPTLQPDFALSNTISGSLTIILPAIVICAIMGRRKYRTTILQRRIQRLNRLWQLDSNKKLS